jgi:sulfite exporter TauE/SafE
LLGALAAGFGSLFALTSYQSLLSFSIGAIFLLMGIGAISGVRIPYLTEGLNRLATRLKSMFNFWLQRKGVAPVFVMGMLNGLLPCGLTYLAMTYCFILPTALNGFAYMVLFGIGTWPVMIGITWLMGLGFKRITINYQKITTVVFIAIGLWMVARSFLSSSDSHTHLFGKASTEEVICP